MYILSIESSCDETSAAVLEMCDGTRRVLSNRIASQIETHALYGGVVPEIASRAHIEAISPITYQALEEAKISLTEIDAIAVTQGPGLIGSLLVGVNFAKSLAYANRIPLVPVEHIHGHIAAAYLTYPELEPPFLALVASGGHTSYYLVCSYTDFEEIGSTRDDAVGEAFDKVARVMRMPYPGGAAMDLSASLGNPDAISFPSPAIGGDELAFSFSGLKTAVINYLNTQKQKDIPIVREDVAASFTATVVRAITEKTESALCKTGMKKLVLAGGVAANSHLRAGLFSLCEKKGVSFYVPDRGLCSDNAAMIGAQGYYEYCAGTRAGTDLNAYPN